MVEQTPLGALASTTGKTAQEQFAAQQSLLFNPTKSLAGGEATIGNTVRTIARHDPEAAQAFVRQHLEQAFNEATQNNLPGANQWGGPKFAAVISGNAQQARNLEAAVRALPGGDVRWAAVRRGLEIMEAMGARQPVGSQTTFNTQIAEHLKNGGLATEFVSAAASPSRLMKIVTELKEKIMLNMNSERMAQALVHGDVTDLRRIAQSSRSSPQGQAAMIALLAKEGALSGPDNSDK